jgi:tRNA(Ile)-lysidine synthase
VRRHRVLLAVRRALEDASLSPGGLVGALSGGADSVALLHALAASARERGLPLHAAHLDHRLRSDSGDDAAFCRELCERLGVPLVTAGADVAGRAAREGLGLEEAARLERRAFLRRVQRQAGASAVALAHTRDDQAETVLMRVLRGSGRSGLAAMRARTRHFIRPLLDVSRADVLDYLAAHGLAWREDPSNRDLRLTRNRVRHELLPYLERHFNPRLRETLARSAGFIADESDVLAAQARALLRRAADGEALRRDPLRDAPPAIARLALRRALEDAGGLADVTSGQVERLRRLACAPASSGRRLPLPGGREAVVRFDRLVIRPRVEPARPFAAHLPVPGRVQLPDGRVLAAEAVAGPGLAADDQAVVPAPRSELSVRTRRPGDRVRAHGREVSLKRFLLDRRVPADLRAGLPLVAEGSRVVWIPGLLTDVQAAEQGRAFVRLRLESTEAHA